MSSFSRHGKEI